MKVVQLAAVTQEGLVEATRQPLAGLSRLPGSLVALTSTPSTRFLRGLLKFYPTTLIFGLIETNGDLVACSVSRKDPAILLIGLICSESYRPMIWPSESIKLAMARTNRVLPFGYPILAEKTRGPCGLCHARSDGAQ
jgi:hypothetical protein